MFYRIIVWFTVVSSAAAEFGQLESPPAMIPGETDDTGRRFSYLAQPAKGGKLILTASNGFFSKGTCRAAGESDLPKVGDEDLIVPNFGYLEAWKSTTGTLRWHIHLARAGQVNLLFDLERSGTSEIEVKLGEHEQSITTGQEVRFQINAPGEHELSLRATRIGDPAIGVGKLHHIEVTGDAMEGAHLLRARWRPAAVHGGYDCSNLSDGRLLVMTTRSTEPVSNYSPITTPFGYFGTSFTGEMISNGEFNFSMWGKEDATDDLRKMPHLIGVGSPEGEFSGFGHEGSGVKPRGWTPMPDQPELCVQALRVEPGEFYDTYYGYYFDHPTEAWKFYGAGKKWHDGKPSTHLKVGSFCEIPGPPHVERTGDIYREVRRRGWYRDGNSWIAMDEYSPGGAGSKGDVPVNKSWYTTSEGEYAMGCGGIRFYTASDPPSPANTNDLPYFLESSSSSSLFHLPIEFGKIQATEVFSDRATLVIEISRGENLERGTVYFGTRDALTFAPRELHGTEKNSGLSQAVADSAWEERIEFDSVVSGPNRVSLSRLQPGRKYFYRVLVENDVSRIWNDETLSFTTPGNGFGSAEPVRIWTYTVAGSERRIEGRLIRIEGGKAVIERKTDKIEGSVPLEILSEGDREYLRGKDSSAR